MIALILSSVIAGIFLTLLAQYLWIRRWFGNIPADPIPYKPQFSCFQMPPELLKAICDPDRKEKKQSCHFLNLIFEFLFKELRDSKEVRRWVARRMNMEFEDMLQTTSGRLMEQIVVRDFNLGTKFPYFQWAVVKNVSMQDSEIEELDIALDIVYTGRFQMAVDVDIMLGKSAFLSITLTKLTGVARLQFTRNPYTHWSFAFYEEPHMEFEAESRFEGKSVSPITTFIINQIKRVVRKKHTLPNYKIRFRPFIFKPSTFHSPKDLYLHGTRLGVGHFEFHVLGCTRLMKMPGNLSLFCTLSLGSSAITEQTSQRKIWVTIDVEITRSHLQPIGITFREGLRSDRDEEVVLVESVVPDSPAAQVDVKKSDIIISVGSIKVTSAKQAVRIIRNAGEKFTFRLQRAHQRLAPNSETRFADETDQGQEMKSDEHLFISDDFIVIPTKPLDDLDAEAKTVNEKPTWKDLQPPPLLPNSGDSMLRRPLTKPSSPERMETQPCSVDPKGTEQKVVESRNENKSPAQSPKRYFLPRQPLPRAQGDGTVRKVHKNEDELLDEDMLDSDVTGDSDEELFDTRKTKLVAFSQKPVWNEKFEFDVEDEHRYLNVCLWCREPEKVDKHERVIKPEKDVLVGHASFPLMDIALDCLTTLQGDTQKSLPLIPAEMKVGASRTKYSNLASHPGFDPLLCHGDITVAFTYTPTERISVDRKKLCKQVLYPNLLDQGGNRIETTEEKILRNHRFVMTQFTSVTYCCFCGKKIWLKVAFQCDVCGMICHKKCTDKCQDKTLCTREGVRCRGMPDEPWKPAAPPQMEFQKPKMVDEKDGGIKSVGLLSKFRKDPGQASKKQTIPGKSPKTSPLPERKAGSLSPPQQSPKSRRRKAGTGGSFSLEAEEDSMDDPKTHLSVVGVPRTRSSTSLRVLLEQNAPPALQTHEIMSKDDKLMDNSDDSDSGTQISMKSIPGMDVSSLDEEIVTAAKEKGRELFTHLSLEERKEKLDSTVCRLQSHIAQETEIKNEWVRKMHEVTDMLQKRAYQLRITKSDEKIESLMILLLHYCAGLQHCLDQQEEERNKMEPLPPLQLQEHSDEDEEKL